MRLQLLEKQLMEAANVATGIVSRLIGERPEENLARGVSPKPDGLLNGFTDTLDDLEAEIGLLRTKLQQISEIA